MNLQSLFPRLFDGGQATLEWGGRGLISGGGGDYAAPAEELVRDEVPTDNP